MTRVEEKAIDAWAIYEYREHPKGLYHTCFVDGYQQGYGRAEKDLKEQIKKDLEHRHELYKIMLEAYPDPNNKHAIDLIARMREVTSLIKYIDSLTDEQH